MNYRMDKLMIDGQTHIHTHAGNDNIRRPILASGKNDIWISSAIGRTFCLCTHVSDKNRAIYSTDNVSTFINGHFRAYLVIRKRLNQRLQSHFSQNVRDTLIIQTSWNQTKMQMFANFIFWYDKYHFNRSNKSHYTSLLCVSIGSTNGLLPNCSYDGIASSAHL